MITEEVRSFHDLIREVKSRGICARCGGCVSFCSAGKLHALRFDADGYPEFASEDACLECGICYLICPQTRSLDDDLRGAVSWKEPMGQHRIVGSARSTDEAVVTAATDGGVVTSLLLHAFDRGLIDAAVLSKATGPFSRVPAVATTREEIIAAAGSHFDAVFHLGEMGDSCTSFVPSVREFSSLYHTGLHRVAIVGTPCQVHSLRKMQVLRIVPADAISLVIGLFCMENFELSEATEETVKSQVGVDLAEITKLNIKEDLIMTTTDGETRHVPFSVVDGFARQSCFACPDFGAEFADISCGGLESPDGYTTVVVRSALGEDVYVRALRDGFIEEMKFGATREAERHRTKLMNGITDFTTRKRARAERTLADA